MARAIPFSAAALEKLGIRRLELDSRKVRPGDTFVAIRGTSRDGRDFIPEAIANGAASVLWDSEDYESKTNLAVPNLGIAELRSNLGAVASHVLGNPSSRLWVIGVTGTNGKTSCSQWIASALTKLDKKCGVVGTLGTGFPGALIPGANTTPDAVALHSKLAGFVDQGARAVAMEVSSHALVQHRVNAVEFDLALFTNLTQDHLDYHGTLSDYRAAKARLFDFPTLKAAALNLDDAFGRELYRRLARPRLDVLGYGFSAGCAVLARDLRQNEAGVAFEVTTPWGTAEMVSPVPGRFNAYNLLATMSALLLSEVSLDRAVGAVQQIEAVPGRMQKLGGGAAPTVIVDYAHTPDALQNVLSTLRETSARALICVFGCGGDRDRAKRPLMGEIASRLADQVVITSDNPRNEDPFEIIADITTGTSGAPQVIADRRTAIEAAVAAAQQHDVVLIAGKGHETYQEVRGVKLPFDDVEVARHALELWSDRNAAAE